MIRLSSLLRVYPGEGPIVARLVLLMTLGQAGATVSATGTESLLFARFGTRLLPVLYVAVGALTILVTLAAGAALRRRPGLGRALPLALVAGTVSARAALAAGGEDLYAALWLAMMVMWTLQGIGLWGIAAAAHDTRQARRLFPLYAGAMIVGVALGGLLTGPLARLFGPEDLWWAWAGAMLLVALLAPGGRAPRAALAAPTAPRRRLGLVGWMAGSIAVLALLHFTVTFLFVRGAVERFPSAVQLAGFLGTFIAVANGAGLAVAVLGANRLIGRFGSTAMVAVLPAVYLLGFAGLALGGGFGVLLGFRLLQLVWMQGVWTGAWQAVFNVVSPGERDRARTLVDGTAFQVGVIASGMLLLVAPSSGVGVVLGGLVASLIAGAAVLGMRRGYRDAVVEAVRRGWPEVFAAGDRRPEEDRSVLDAVLAAAGDRDPALRRLAMEMLTELADVPEGVVRGGLQDPDEGVRLAALDALAGRPAAADAARPLLEDLSPTVRLRAAGLVLPAGSSRAEALVDEGLRDPDAAVRSEALSAIASSKPSRVLVASLPALEDADPSVRAAAAASLRSVGPQAVPQLLAALQLGGSADAALLALAELPVEDPRPLRVYARAQAALAAEDARLARLAGPDVTGPWALLGFALRSRAEEAAGRALEALTPLAGGRSIRVALDGLRADASVRADALEALEAVGDPEVVRPLLALWEPRDSGRRERQLLEGSLAHPDPWIRACAAFAARRAGAAEQRLEALARSDPDPLVRECAGMSDGVGLLERVMFLRGVSLFTNLSAADLRRIAEAVVERELPDGATLAERGESGDEMHVVVSGRLRVVLPHGEIARGPGEVVGEMALLDDAGRMATVVADGAVRTLALDRARFRRILRERPEVALGVMRVLSARLREIPGPGEGSRPPPAVPMH